ncbi:MAG: pantoate--beta-alanine ligase [Balneolales bacterium]
MIKSRVKVTRTIADSRKAIGKMRESGLKIGFVPTMGALHLGHISLIQKAKELVDVVIVSIFVNPTQFGPREDFSSYPRPLQKDLELCEEHDVSMVFHPDVDEMYGEENLIDIKAGEMAKYLCGKSRPDHFDGVLQVVNKLFNIIRPDVAVFGQKDIQQLYVIRQMVSEFKMDLDVVMAPTKRESDGLAISSRNVYLTSSQRKSAPFLYQTLCDLADLIKSGQEDIQPFIRSRSAEFKEKGLIIDYLSCAEPPRMVPVSRIKKNRDYILAGAVFAGDTRLIDNLIIHT